MLNFWDQLIISSMAAFMAGIIVVIYQFFSLFRRRRKSLIALCHLYKLAINRIKLVATGNGVSYGSITIELINNALLEYLQYNDYNYDRTELCILIYSNIYQVSSHLNVKVTERGELFSEDKIFPSYIYKTAVSFAKDKIRILEERFDKLINMLPHKASRITNSNKAN